MESLGFRNRKMRAAARDRHGEYIYLDKRLEEYDGEEKSSGNISALFAESAFHEDGVVETDGVKEDDYRRDFANHS